jgi:hypothetical protein
MGPNLSSLLCRPYPPLTTKPREKICEVSGETRGKLRQGRAGFRHSTVSVGVLRLGKKPLEEQSKIADANHPRIRVRQEDLSREEDLHNPACLEPRVD